MPTRDTSAFIPLYTETGLCAVSLLLIGCGFGVRTWTAMSGDPILTSFDPTLNKTRFNVHGILTAFILTACSTFISLLILCLKFTQGPSVPTYSQRMQILIVLGITLNSVSSILCMLYGFGIDFPLPDVTALIISWVIAGFLLAVGVFLYVFQLYTHRLLVRRHRFKNLLPTALLNAGSADRASRRNSESIDDLTSINNNNNNNGNGPKPIKNGLGHHRPSAAPNGNHHNGGRLLVEKSYEFRRSRLMMNEL